MQVVQLFLSNLKLISNGQADSNGQIVGLEEIKDKTLELNTVGDLKEGVNVSSNINTCMVEKPQECFGGNVPSDPSDGQEKRLTKHGRGKPTRTQKQKKLKILFAGVSQQKGKQTFNRSFGGGNHGRAQLACNVNELAVLGDQVSRGNFSNSKYSFRLIGAKTTEVWGWVDVNQREAWKNLFPLTPVI